MKSTRWLRYTSTLSIGVVMTVVLVSGLAKAFDLPRFEFDLRSWTLVPVWLQHIALLLVPSLEVSLTVAWFLGLMRNVVSLAVAFSLGLFTTTYAVHLVLGVKPRCGCGAALVAFELIHRDGPVLIIKNIGLLSLLAIGMLTRRFSLGGITTTANDDPGSGAHREAANSRAGGAFTLLEVILVIALIGILISLLLPALTGVRSRSREVQSLSQIQQHVGIMAMYAQQFDDFMPYFTDPGPSRTVLRNPAREYEVTIPYFGAHSHWNVALAADFYNGDHLSPVFQSPDNPERIAHTSGYWYSCTFLADARFWNPSFREPAPRQWKPVHLADVAFASRKGVLLDSFHWLEDLQSTASRSSRIGFADGSARVIRPGRVTAGYSAGEAPGTGAMHGAWWPPIHHTIDGVRGRDVQE